MTTINLSWSQKGLADSFNIYRSTSTIDINNLPTPVASVTTKTYMDTGLESGSTYYYRVESIRNNERAISDELVVYTAQPWTPDSLLNKVFWLDGDHIVTSGSNITQMTDRSGNSKHFVNNTAANLPTLALDTSLNRNIVKLASAKLVNTGLASSYSGASGYYVFCVFRHENTTAETNPTLFNLLFTTSYNMCWMMAGGVNHAKSPAAFLYDSASSSANTMVPAILGTQQVAANWTMALFHVDGQSIKMTDPPITRKTAQEWAKAHVAKDEIVFRKSLHGVKLSQVEYDTYLDFTYNFGQANWNNSSMLRNLKQGKYVQACQSLLKWKYVAKRDCSIRSNNCYGVWTRQVDRYQKCIGVQ